MKVTMELTLDGLVRALRWRAIALAEEAEAGYAGATRSSPLKEGVITGRDGQNRIGELGDERRGG